MSIESAPEPRAHHHFFCHVLLPQLAFSDPQRFITTFGVPAGIDYLRDVWKGVGEREFPGQSLPDTGLSLHPRVLSTEALAIIVEPPPPVGMTESYFVAAVFDSPEPRRPPRVYSLELSFIPTREQPITMLCAFRPEGRLNYGSGPAPKLEAFVAELEFRERATQ